MSKEPAAGRKRLGRWAMSLAFVVGVVALLLYLAGKFSPKVSQPPAATSTETTSVPADRLVTVQRISVPQIEPAVGTVRAVHETTIGSKLLARVVQADIKAGQEVHQGEALVRLDDTELRARLEQASAAVAQAEAVHAQAAADEHRYAQLVKSRSVSQQQYDNAVTALRSADAELRRTRAAFNEAKAALSDALVQAPFDAVVIDKRVAAGDMVRPGQMLVSLFDPKHMQLVASVRESLTSRLKPGQVIDVRLEGHQQACSGTISEIVPEAQSASRSFQVKVIGPCPSGVYSGMFGRVLIPLDEEQVLVVPSRAVQNVGQLNLVDVLVHGVVQRRAVLVGRQFGDRVEVLSGLSAGEQVVLPASPQ
ncbi:MAG: efflux RND transporter periplasmic adaptor subunit [Planctomycetaceae bacterium]|nr:efflux RND transporter periplasmic adaptor subunit [Planctomycetaceae bacterium]